MPLTAGSWNSTVIPASYFSFTTATKAVIEGYAIGGGNHLAYFCDFTVAAEHAIFGQNGARVGSPAYGWIVGYSVRLVGAKRAREINSYYSQLGEGRGEFVPPLAETGDLRSKPLAIALQEIAEGKVVFERLEAPGLK